MMAAALLALTLQADAAPCEKIWTAVANDPGLEMQVQVFSALRESGVLDKAYRVK